MGMLTPKCASHGSNQELDFLRSEASKIGFPVLIKAVKGGGGKGMRIAMTADVFDDQLRSAKSEAMNSFGDNVMLIEKYITTPRHVEVQIFADKHGMYLYTSEAISSCSGPFCGCGGCKTCPKGKRGLQCPLSYLSARVLIFKEGR